MVEHSSTMESVTILWIYPIFLIWFYDYFEFFGEIFLNMYNSENYLELLKRSSFNRIFLEEYNETRNNRCLIFLYEEENVKIGNIWTDIEGWVKCYLLTFISGQVYQFLHCPIKVLYIFFIIYIENCYKI